MLGTMKARHKQHEKRELRTFPILSEKTQIFTQSPLSESLELFYDEVARIPQKQLQRTQQKVEKIIRYVFPRIKKHAVKLGLRLRSPVYSGSTYNDLQVVASEEVDVLFPFDKEKSKVDMIEPGYAILPLKRHKQQTIADPWRYGRSVDGLFLSPLQVSRTIHELLNRALTVPVEVPNVVLEPLFDDSNSDRHPGIRIILGKTLKINIIPAILQEDGKPTLITRTYTYDENPNSDMLWRLVFTDKETKVLSLMDSADRGCRREALKIVKALFIKEHTLHGLTSYHLKTILFHAFDEEVDQTPRWQRDELEMCVLSLFRDLLTYLRNKNLPHFFIRDYNLLNNIPQRTLHNLKNRIAYIVANENELLRILRKRDKICRTRRRKLKSTATSESGETLLSVSFSEGNNLSSESSLPSAGKDIECSMSSFPSSNECVTQYNENQIPMENVESNVVLPNIFMSSSNRLVEEGYISNAMTE